MTSSISSLPNSLKENNVVMNITDKTPNNTVSPPNPMKGNVVVSNNNSMSYNPNLQNNTQGNSIQASNHFTSSQNMNQSMGGTEPHMVNNLSNLSQDSINKIVKGLQQASMSNMTNLSSKDIPMTTENFTSDNTIKPNYIPKESNNDYIKNHEDIETMIQNSKIKEEQKSQLDTFYDELHTPFTMMLLFLFMQMPFFQENMQTLFPSLFLKDGNPTMMGYLVKTIFFGLVYYLIQKLTNYLSDM